MSGTVVFEDAKLQAVELIAETVTLNNFSVSTATTFQQTTNASNVTTNTLRFTNPATAFVTTGNVEVGTANLFVDTTTGMVGIGTGSPGSLLSIESTTGNQMRLNYNADWYNVIERDSSGNLNFLEKAGSSASLANHMTIKTGGNVGIGTTGPEDILDIRKGSGTGEVSVQVRSGGLFIRRHNGSTYPLIQTDFGMTRPRIMMSDTSGTCLLYTSPSPRDRQKSRMPSSA